MTKKLLIILLIVVVGTGAVLSFFYWQTRVELVSQTKEVGDLLKQIDTLEKQIEELEKQTKEVTIVTDKTEYEPGETVKIKISNILDENIFTLVSPVLTAYSDISIEKKLTEGSWRGLAITSPPPPYMPNLNDYTKINSGDSYESTWDQKIFNSDTGKRYFIESGIFRVKFRYITESKAFQLGYLDERGIYPEKEDFITIYSNEFTIKEKTTQEVTITTDKTEYEQGEIIEMNLVNPLASPVYYYWNGWPGSSWWSIYRLNEVEDTWEKIETNCTLSPGAIISCDGKQGPFWDPGAERCLNITSEEIKWEQKVCEVKENYCPTESKVESYSSVIREPAQSGRYKFVATYQQDSTCKTELETLETQFIIK